MAKLSTLSLGSIWGPVDGKGEAVTISVSVTGSEEAVGARLATGVEVVVVGMVVVVVGEGNGGKLVTVVV